MIIEIYTPYTLSEEDKEALWNLGIEMEDWDYMLLVDASILEAESSPSEPKMYEGLDGKMHKKMNETLRDVGDNFDLPWSLLHGHYSNKWHIAEFKGKRRGIGIAYHG